MRTRSPPKNRGSHTSVRKEEITMYTGRLVTVLLVFAASFAISPSGLAQESPPQSAKAKEIVALVEKAAAVVESRGTRDFVEFRKSGSKWLYDDTYLFVSDMKGIALFNARFPNFEGTDTSALKDSNGKLIVMESIKAAQSTSGSGWVNY